MVKSFEEGPDTNQQLLEIEWFDNIVICTCLEALDLVFCRIHGGEHDDENVFIDVADMACQLIPIHQRKINVEDSKVIGIGVKQFPADGSVISHVAIVVLLGQSFAQRLRDFFLIFNE